MSDAVLAALRDALRAEGVCAEVEWHDGVVLLRDGGLALAGTLADADRRAEIVASARALGLGPVAVEIG